MSGRFKKLSHVIYYHVYHIVWTPKYRYRILQEELRQFTDDSIRLLCEWKQADILELNVQPDHVHLVISLQPKLSVSEFMGIVKGKTAIKIFKSYPGLRKKPYWGNHFWAKGYCSSTVGLDEEKIRKYVKYQEEQERREEAQQSSFEF